MSPTARSGSSASGAGRGGTRGREEVLVQVWAKGALLYLKERAGLVTVCGRKDGERMSSARGMDGLARRIESRRQSSCASTDSVACGASRGAGEAGRLLFGDSDDGFCVDTTRPCGASSRWRPRRSSGGEEGPGEASVLSAGSPRTEGTSGRGEATGGRRRPEEIVGGDQVLPRHDRHQASLGAVVHENARPSDHRVHRGILYNFAFDNIAKIETCKWCFFKSSDQLKCSETDLRGKMVSSGSWLLVCCVALKGVSGHGIWPSRKKS